MPKLKPIELPELTGGINTAEETTIEDNQLVDAKNYYYDTDKILKTRKGSTNFGNALPDAVTVIHNMDTFNGNGTWVGSSDATSVATEASDHKRGTGAVEFDVTTAASADNKAVITNTTMAAVDLSGVKETGAIKLWIYIPDITELTNIQLEFGDGLGANDYSFTATTQANGIALADGWNFLSLPWSSSNISNGAPTGSVDEARVTLNYSAIYGDQTGVYVDHIVWYSPTNTQAQHSGVEFKDSSENIYTLIGCGANIFELDESTRDWDVIKTGLTSGTRFTAVMYKDVMYITNGVDNYMDYDGKAVTEYAGVDKGKYLIVASDVAYLAGIDGDESTVVYTNANPANLQTFPNTEPINEDDGQIIVGLSYIGALVIVFKERSVYSYDSISSPTVVTNLDYDGGATAHTAITRVENDVYFMADLGVVSLSQRQGVSGSFRSSPISRNIQTKMDLVTDKAICASFYSQRTHNYYLSVADDGTSLNKTIYVLSFITGGWTYYQGINANGFFEHEDANGDWHMLALNSYGGQTIEMETGYDDNGSAIASTLKTKVYDFETTGLVKVFQRCDLGGIHTSGSSVTATITVTNKAQVTRSATVAYNAATDILGSTSTTYETDPLATNPLGAEPLVGTGYSGGTLAWYRYLRHIPMLLTGSKAQLTITGSQTNAQFGLNKFSLFPIATPRDFVPSSLYI